MLIRRRRGCATAIDVLSAEPRDAAYVDNRIVGGRSNSELWKTLRILVNFELSAAVKRTEVVYRNAEVSPCTTTYIRLDQEAAQRSRYLNRRRSRGLSG